MRRVRYLAPARRDIADIYHYIEQRSGSSVIASRFIQRLRRQCSHIAELPTLLGRSRPEFGRDIRTFSFESYLIVLRYADGVLDIVNIYEGHRDIEAIFRKSD